jgi:2-polyprenyl-3-methyl-5-hydroxy-6-metoxy-1,4-benzoquinol methylase
MKVGHTPHPLTCWCGNRDLHSYSPDYRACQVCGTLVSRIGLAGGETAVNNDDLDFYGKSYWLGHQTQELGLPDIACRARTDLAGRCMYWLRTVLRHKLPPARVLEVGCAHGGFVTLLRWQGYDAVGLELSPWVVDFAQRTFDVPVLLGPVERQDLPERSFDVVVLNDVLEHLADPVATLEACVRLLKDDGALIIQTPCFPEGASYADLLTQKNRFLEMMDGPAAREHLYLFSPRAARRLLGGLGLAAVEFLPALFEYDMYFVAGRQAVALKDPDALAEALLGTSHGRLCLAWLELLTEYEAREADRATRLEQIHRLHDMLRESEASREALLAVNQRLTAAAQRPLVRIAGAVHSWGRRLRRTG